MSITSRSERVKKRVCFGHEFRHDVSRFDYQARALAAVCEMRMRS